MTATDPSATRVAALQKEAQELRSEATKLRKEAASGDPKVVGRLKEIVARLHVVQSEHATVLTSSPIAAVDAADDAEVKSLTSENRDLRRRNTELEKVVSTLQADAKQAKDLVEEASSRVTIVEGQEAVLLRRIEVAEAEVEALRKEVKEAPPDQSSYIAVLEDTTRQLADAARRVEEFQIAIDLQTEKTEQRVASATSEINGLRFEVGQLESSLNSEVERANAAELVANQLREEALTISRKVSEAKKLMQKAKTDQNRSSGLRDWAQSELKRLEQQLAAAPSAA